MSYRKAETDAEVVRFVRDYATTNGYPPSIREVAEAIGCVESTAMARVQRLVRDELLRSAPKRARSLTVTPHGMKLIGGTAEL